MPTALPARVALGLAGAVSLLLALGVLLVRPRRLAVEGYSMAPTLLPGDRLLAVRASRIGIGDLVVVRDPRDQARLLVKRVASFEPGGRMSLIGDNPEASTDSRTFGTVGRAEVVGKVARRYWPPHRASIEPG
jgi:nickel-type superoxide dismutase maturation protease